jgi:hypothetical protein
MSLELHYSAYIRSRTPTSSKTTLESSIGTPSEEVKEEKGFKSPLLVYYRLTTSIIEEELILTIFY